MKHALFVAAENAALPGGKVGGIGDVIRDLPIALTEAGWRVSVVIPAYGFLHATPDAQVLDECTVSFAGKTEIARIYAFADSANGVQQIVIDHPLLAPNGPGRIYCDDGADRPFATDASKFAFFCAATAAWLADRITANDAPDVVHLHDWHAAFLLLLRTHDPAFTALKSLPCVFTIHNLALQGIRPLRDDASSLATWYPELTYVTEDVSDPRYPDCINPMAMAIRLADRVNTVSPTYAHEICLPDDPARDFHGGEGLHADTQQAAEQHRLIGILNGCFYPDGTRPRGWRPLLDLLRNSPDGIDVPENLHDKLRLFSRRRPVSIATSVGRFTPQKVDLFLQPVGTSTALELILETLGSDSILLILGSGDHELEARLAAIMTRHPNAVLLRGYNERLAQQLYDSGDLFLMPSSFEPCGISQMLAMRSGQPCVVNGVGGLQDTVEHNKTGFVFRGDSPATRAAAFVAAVAEALTLHATDAVGWRQVSQAAAAKRFSWLKAARCYIDQLYLPASADHET
jgi:starch synthase